MKRKFYKLNADHSVEAIETDDIKDYVAMLVTGELVTSEILAKDAFERCSVSTIFMSLDHGHGISGKPLVFETMFEVQDLSGNWTTRHRRYSSYDDAMAGHKAIVDEYRAAVRWATFQDEDATV